VADVPVRESQFESVPGQKTTILDLLEMAEDDTGWEEIEQ